MNSDSLMNHNSFPGSRVRPASSGLRGSWGRNPGVDPALGTGDRIGVVTIGQEQPLLATGEFARRSGLSLKALRIYDQNGLLKPAAVEPGSGRRGYGPDQIRPARLIG